MNNQKYISTWDTEDVSNWLKNINMNQYISKFETNQINGYDLIYLTKEDLKSLGIVSIHDKNIILNSMKDALLQQLKLNVNFKEKYATIQLDFDPNYTVEQLTNTLKLIFKPLSSIFLVVNNNEILMSNLKIIDLILYNPKVYKNFQIKSDSQLFNINLNNNLKKDYSNNKTFNYNTKNSQKELLTHNKFNENYYKINIQDNYNTDNINTTPFIKSSDNNPKEKYINNFTTSDKNEYPKTYLDEKEQKKINNMNNKINNNDIKYNNEELNYNKYKYEDYKKIDFNQKNYGNELRNKNINTYEKFDNKRDLLYNQIDNKPFGNNINKGLTPNNNAFEYNRNITPNQNESKRTKTITTYRKKYSIENGELNFEVEVDKNKKNRINNNLNYGTLKKEEDDNQKFSSEKRNFRTNEFKTMDDYDNNRLKKDNYTSNYIYRPNNELNNSNYDINYFSGNKDKSNDKMNNTTGFRDLRKYNNEIDLNLKYNQINKI